MITSSSISVHRLPLLLLLLMTAAGAMEPFVTPAQPSGGIDITICPCEGISGKRLVTFGMPFPRGSLTAVGLDTVRILRGERELPATVAVLALWRHMNDPAKDGASVRVARVQFDLDLGAANPTGERLRVEWGTGKRRVNGPAMRDARDGWHQVTSGSFAADDHVFEPDVFVLLPAAHLCRGLLRPTPMEPFDPAIGEARDDPATLAGKHFFPALRWDQLGAKDFFYTIANRDDPKVATNNLCHFKDKAAVECWLFDRSSAMFSLYLRSGFLAPLREAVRAADYYANHLGSDGFFAFKPGDAKYCYNECLAYAAWLTGDEHLRSVIPTVCNAYKAVRTRWDPKANFWTERHTGFKLMAQAIAYEAMGDAASKAAVQQSIDDLLWHQDGAGGLLPANRVDGGLYHYGRQHDGDWPENELGASPWMSAQIPFDAMLRCYQSSESEPVARFLYRHGIFLAKSIAKADKNGGIDYPRYAVLADGRTGQNDEWTDPQHCLEVASGLAWSAYFARQLGIVAPELGAGALALYRTYDQQISNWVRAEAPASGASAFRVGPWRKYNWEYRTSGGLSWALRQAGVIDATAGAAPPAAPKAAR